MEEERQGAENPKPLGNTGQIVKLNHHNHTNEPNDPNRLNKLNEPNDLNDQNHKYKEVP
jgi:hypothetical protein